MTNSDVFPYEIIQPIFLSILPGLVDYYLLDFNPQWRISQILIIGSPYDCLEQKHSNQFKLPIFLCGCILNKTDELPTKLRILTKINERILQKSIEEQVNHASACLFAFFI